MSRDDYAIICGDFGGLWTGDNKDKHWMDWLAEKEWHGGRVHEVRENILHLMRGQVFIFGGLTWFTMGGAVSHDIQDGILDPEDPGFERKYWLMRRMRGMFRVKGHSWWAEEMPSDKEYAEALSSLERVNWKVNRILIHCGPTSVIRKITPSYEADRLTDFLEVVSRRCQFTYWFLDTTTTTGSSTISISSSGSRYPGWNFDPPKMETPIVTSESFNYNEGKHSGVLCNCKGRIGTKEMARGTFPRPN